MKLALALISLRVLATPLSAQAGDAIETNVSPLIANFHAVVPGKIYRGTRPDGDGLNWQGLDALAANGIRLNLSLQGGDRLSATAPLFETGESQYDLDDERAITSLVGMSFVNLPLNALFPVTGEEDASIDRALELIDDPSNQPVFFHCRHGKDRTGLVAALYRVLYQGCSPQKAREEWLKYGHGTALIWLRRYFDQEGRSHSSSSGRDASGLSAVTA